MTPDRQRFFVQTLTAIFQARQEVADLFFQHRVTECIQEVLESHIQYCLAEDSMRVRAHRDHVRALRQADGLFEEISYLKKGDLIAFAVARERILSYIRTVVREEKTGLKKDLAFPKPEQSSIPQKTEPLETKLLGTPQKILEFVRRAPSRRAKDIIDEFSALSGRTIKRGLKELSQKGLIVRKEDNKAVYYSAVN